MTPEMGSHERAAHTGSDKCFLIGDGPDHVTIDGNTVEGVNIGSGFYLNGKPKATELTIITTGFRSVSTGCCWGNAVGRESVGRLRGERSLRGEHRSVMHYSVRGQQCPLPYLNSLIIGTHSPEVQGVRLARDHDGEPLSRACDRAVGGAGAVGEEVQGSAVNAITDAITVYPLDILHLLGHHGVLPMTSTFLNNGPYLMSTLPV